jgi:hypothetical protein
MRPGFARPARLLPLAALMAACTPAAPDPPRFPLSNCAVHAVVDAATGQPLKGIEDLAPGPGDTLILSADDRARRTPAEGGLYAVPREAVLLGSTRARALLAPGQLSGGLHPHGLAVDGQRLAFVNRRILAGDTADPVVVEADMAADGLHVRAIHKAPGFCALNDLAYDGAALLATLSEAGCPPSALDRALARSSGTLAVIDADGIRGVAEGFGFANGVAVLADGRVAVAETRGRRVRLSDGHVLPLEGGPDNLSLGPDGRLVTALIPSLPRFLLYRFGLTDTAPTRIVAVAPATGAVETLFDDPGGTLLSGISSALWLGDALVAGSVLGEGLLVCRA